MFSLRDIIETQDGEEYIKDANDTFHLEKPSTWKMSKLDQALPSAHDEENEKEADESGGGNAEDRIVDYNKVIKQVVAHEDNLPTPKETPYFNHDAFYSNLKAYQASFTEAQGQFGKQLLYGEVVTSTNTMLEKSVPCSQLVSSNLTFS